MEINNNNIKISESISNLKKSIIKIESTIENYNKENKLNHSDIQSNHFNELNKKYQDQLKRNEKHQEEKNDLQRKLELQDFYLNEYKCNFTRVNEQIKHIEYQFKNFKESYNKLIKIQNEREEERINHLKSIQSLNQMIKEINNEKQTLQQEKQQYEMKIQYQSDFINEKNDEEKRLYSTIENLREELSRSEVEKKDLIKIIDDNIRSKLN